MDSMDPEEPKPLQEPSHEPVPEPVPAFVPAFITDIEAEPLPEVEKGTTHPWYKLWWDIWSMPGMASFETLLAEPNGSPVRALIWMLIVGLLSGIVSAIVQTTNTASIEALLPRQMLTYLRSFGVLSAFICTPIFTIVGLFINGGIYHLVAKIFHGEGTWDQMVFCLGAVQGPLTLFSLLTTLPIFLLRINPTSSTVLLVYLFLWLVGLVVSLYGLVLTVIAVKTVEEISTGSAILTVLMPMVLFFAVFACLFGTVYVNLLQQLPNLQ